MSQPDTTQADEAILEKAIAHCRKAHRDNCVMDVGDHRGIPCNATNCLPYLEVLELTNSGR